VATVSHSRLSCFESCALQYKYRYLDKLEGERGESIEAFMGKRVHEALQKLYTDLKHERLLDEEELIAFYRKEWERNFHEGILIVKDYTAENYLAMGEKALRTYHKRFQPFNQATTLATEKLILMDLAQDVQLKGYIDRLDRTPEGVYEIHDYKTSGTLPDQSDVDTDRQLALYALAVKREFPDAKNIRLIWHYLLFGMERESSRTEQELEQLTRETVALARSVLAAQSFPPHVSRLCDWCEFQPICPEWSHLFRTRELKPEEFRKEDGVQLVDEYVRFSDEKHAAEQKLEEVKQRLISYAQREQVNAVFGRDQQARIWTKETVKLPDHSDPQQEELVRLLKLLGRFTEVTRLDSWELGKIIEERRWPSAVLKQLEPFCRKERIYRIYLRDRE